MNKDTVNAIALLLSLFTEEEKEGLKITLGEKEVSLQEQFSGRWFNSRPRYTGKLFLWKAAHIVNGNRLLFTRVIEFAKPEFQERLKLMLSDPETYMKIKETKTDNKDTKKGVALGQGASLALSKAFNKNRSGLSESGQEYIDLEKIWAQEDSSIFETVSMPTHNLKAEVKLDPEKPGIDGISLGVIAQEKQPINFKQSEPVRNYDLPLHSINVSQGTNQGSNQSSSENLNLNSQENNLDGKTVAKDMVRFEALQLMTATKIKDPRETAFQKLDVLFFSVCP